MVKMGIRAWNLEVLPGIEKALCTVRDEGIFSDDTDALLVVWRPEFML